MSETPDTTAADTGEPEPTTERWVFGGSRIIKGKRYHAWIDPSGTELLYAPVGSPTVGSIYEVKVARRDDIISKYKHATVYTGDRADPELRDRLFAQHRAAETALSLASRERADKRDDPVEKAIERLVELGRNVPASQRTGFASYIVARLIRDIAR